MNLGEKISELSEKVSATRSVISTEEATKMAYIVPFIKALGYDTEDPEEVVPEFTCDAGSRKGDKVDYAIMSGSEPQIIIEAKDVRNKLTEANVSQLSAYFNNKLEVNLAILTNGIEYRFYADTEAINHMDAEPYYVFNILDYTDADIAKLECYTKDNFDMQSIRDNSKVNEIYDAFNEWFTNQRISVCDSFLRYIRRELNTDVSDTILRSCIHDVLVQYGAKAESAQDDDWDDYDWDEFLDSNEESEISNPDDDWSGYEVGGSNSEPSGTFSNSDLAEDDNFFPVLSKAFYSNITSTDYDYIIIENDAYPVNSVRDIFWAVIRHIDTYHKDKVSVYDLRTKRGAKFVFREQPNGYAGVCTYKGIYFTRPEGSKSIISWLHRALEIVGLTAYVHKVGNNIMTYGFNINK